MIGANGNSKTYIKRAGDNGWGSDQEADTPGILSCFSPRSFILRWGYGGLSLTDQYGNLVLQWTDNNYLPVYSLTVAGRGTNERWTFDKSAGNVGYIGS